LDAISDICGLDQNNSSNENEEIEIYSNILSNIYLNIPQRLNDYHVPDIFEKDPLYIKEELGKMFELKMTQINRF
jgi:hypothetical protein